MREVKVCERFWAAADEIVTGHEVVIDRPQGSGHPRVEGIVYPLDYGYLKGTAAMDGQPIDVWRGSISSCSVTGVIVTADLFKHDAEVKFLIGCTPTEAELALATHNTEWQAGFLVLRAPGGRHGGTPEVSQTKAGGIVDHPDEVASAPDRRE